MCVWEYICISTYKHSQWYILLSPYIYIYIYIYVPKKKVEPSTTPRCSSYWRGSLWVPLHYSQLTYIYIYIYIWRNLKFRWIWQDDLSTFPLIFIIYIYIYIYIYKCMCVCLYISVSGRQDDSSERRSNSLEIWDAILERKEATSIYEQHNRHRMPPPRWL